jgi:hypothetical protein
MMNLPMINRPDSPASPDPLPDLLRHIAEVAGGGPFSLTIEIGGRHIEIRATNAGTDSPPQIQFPLELNESEATFLRAVLEGAVRGQDIATASGYPFDSVRRSLSELRRRRLLTGEMGDTGCGLTAEGREALAAFEAKESTPAPRPPAQLNELELDILRAALAKPLTGDLLAKAAKYPYDGRFKATLSSLRRMGFLENYSPGYKTTPYGVDVLSR